MQKSRLLLVSLVAVILLIAATFLVVWLLPGIYVYLPGGEQYYTVDPQSKYVEGQTFSGDETRRLINISQNDFYASGFIRHINSSTDMNYTIGNVAVGRYLERDPYMNYGLFNPHYYKLLPAVEYLFGDRWDEGINMYAFVDPDKDRVAYVGYIVRYGLQGDNYTYTSATEGVNINRIDRGTFTIGTMINVTIIETGINPLHNVTPAQENEWISIALNDTRVSEYIRGRSYKTNIGGSGFTINESPENYILNCPNVYFLPNDTSNLPFYTWASIDPIHKTVTYVGGPPT